MPDSMAGPCDYGSVGRCEEKSEQFRDSASNGNWKCHKQVAGCFQPPDAKYPWLNVRVIPCV